MRGDPHEKTLDGVKFTYSGACFYDILYIDSDFFIRGHYQKCRNDKSCVDEVYILYKSHLISFLKEDIVKHDSANVNNFPYTTSDGLIKIREATGVYKYEVVLPNSVNVKWDGERKILIDVGMSFYGATQGKLLHVGEPRRGETCFLGFPPGLSQTGLYNDRRW